METTTTTTPRRKLSRNWRRANAAYKVVLSIITGVNIMLLALNNSESFSIPNAYFEVFSVLSTCLPIGWSKLLDVVKEYEEELTPSPSVDEISERDSVDSNESLGVAKTETKEEKEAKEEQT